MIRWSVSSSSVTVTSTSWISCSSCAMISSSFSAVFPPYRTPRRSRIRHPSYLMCRIWKITSGSFSRIKWLHSSSLWSSSSLRRYLPSLWWNSTHLTWPHHSWMATMHLHHFRIKSRLALIHHHLPRSHSTWLDWTSSTHRHHSSLWINSSSISHHVSSTHLLHSPLWIISLIIFFLK